MGYQFSFCVRKGPCRPGKQGNRDPQTGIVNVT